MQMRMKIAAGAMSLCCVLASQAETVLSWSAADTGTSYAGGAVTVTRDAANKVVKLSVDPDAAGGLRFTGETITFADAGGEIAVASYGDLAFETALSCAGKLSFTTTVEVFKDLSVSVTTGKATLLQNAKTEDWDVWFSREEGLMRGHNYPYFAKRSGTTLYAQLQRCTTVTKCIQAVFEQAGSDVTLRYYGGVGRDYPSNLRGYDVNDYTGTQNYNYYPSHLRLIRRTGFVTVSLRKAVSAGSLDIGGGLAVYADGNDAPVASGGAFDVPVNIEDGHFGFRGRTAGITLKMPVTGHNCELDFLPSADELELPAGNGIVTFAFAAGANVTTNGTINIVGSPSVERILSIDAKGLLPGLAGPTDDDDALYRGRVLVGSWGRLKYTVSGGNGVGHNKYTEVIAYDGGVVESAKYWCNNCLQLLFLDGGVWEFNTKNQPEYLGKVVMRDGAIVRGTSEFMGATTSNQDQIWTVTGVSPSTFESDFVVNGNGYASGDRTYTFAVDDVTGSDAVDFVTTKRLRESGTANYNRVILRKDLAGTMRLNGQCLFYYKPIEILSGTWMLGTNDVCDANVNYALKGGCLAAAANTTNKVGAVSLTKDSTMKVEDGASLAFADCSVQSWTGTLRITANLRKSSIRFGTDSAGITAAQLGQIRVNGHRAYINDEGYLVPGGLAIIAR